MSEPMDEGVVAAAKAIEDALDKLGDADIDAGLGWVMGENPSLFLDIARAAIAAYDSPARVEGRREEIEAAKKWIEDEFDPHWGEDRNRRVAMETAKEIVTGLSALPLEPAA